MFSRVSSEVTDVNGHQINEVRRTCGKRKKRKWKNWKTQTLLTQTSVNQHRNFHFLTSKLIELLYSCTPPETPSTTTTTAAVAAAAAAAARGIRPIDPEKDHGRAWTPKGSKGREETRDEREGVTGEWRLG
ncbi:hypothetical protein K0M31_010041 [Melipona bicolor]|uniref:Uncharacterized protein n=1 Tax=Melipona bicolor TaxID=60889 RepID=A0AA40FMC2_9HYME|nr:hypothetical protein K0M31_010041 [Melipona bicolor]